MDGRMTAVAILAAAAVFGTTDIPPVPPLRSSENPGSPVRQGAAATLYQGLEKAGEALVGQLGCGACHTDGPGPDVIRGAAPVLGAGQRPLPAAYVFEYLANPVRVRTDIGPARMPSFPLTEEERLALALFLAAPDSADEGTPAFRAAVAAYGDGARDRGAVLFERLNCAGCHRHEEIEGKRRAQALSHLGPRVRSEWLRDYLSSPGVIRPAGDPPGSGSRMPDFRLSEAELAALVAYLTTAGPTSRTGVTSAGPELTPFSAWKAEALLKHELPCLGCHRLGSDGGRVGPALDGVGQRLRPEVLRGMVRDPGAFAPGSVMPEHPLRDDRLELVVAFLASRETPWRTNDRVVEAIPLPDPEGAATPGEALYLRLCAHCHGPEGNGDGYNAPFLPTRPTAHADSAYMSSRPDDALFDGIHAGARILDRSHRMPAYGQSLSRQEIRSLIRHIRRLCNCRQPSWAR